MHRYQNGLVVKAFLIRLKNEYFFFTTQISKKVENNKRNQVQDVYRLQGVIINDKHIEVILRQMLKKIEVKNSGDSTYLPGEIVDQIKFENTNEKLKKVNIYWMVNHYLMIF